MVWSMRFLTAVLLLAAASPAAAQHPQTQLDDLRMQQEAAHRRAIDQQNQLTALETRLRAEQGAADLRRTPPEGSSPCAVHPCSGRPSAAPGCRSNPGSSVGILARAVPSRSLTVRLSPK